jgi:hypothetical protein
MVKVPNYSQEADMEAFTVKRTNLWTQKLNGANAIITLYVLITNNIIETQPLLNKITNVPSHHHFQLPNNFKGF